MSCIVSNVFIFHNAKIRCLFYIFCGQITEDVTTITEKLHRVLFFYDGKYWLLGGLVFDVWKGNKSGNYCLQLPDLYKY
jgi:hypothetical protein